MKNTMIAGFLGLGLAASSGPAWADGWSHYHGHWGGHAHVSGDAFLVGVGVVAGAFALSAMLSPPRYYAPQVYYGPPPVANRPSSYCVQDDVYRTLPDGRIQTGVRTTCY